MGIRWIKLSEVKKSIDFQKRFSSVKQTIKKLPGEVTKAINKKVGFRLVTKFGEKGVINLGKALPLVGGVIGGTVDGIGTHVIGKTAKTIFK